MSAADFRFLETLDTRTATSNPELLLSAVPHLMSQYKTNTTEQGPCLKLAAIIEKHLQALSEIRSLSPGLRATCQQLADQWADLVDRALPPSLRPCLLARFELGN